MKRKILQILAFIVFSVSIAGMPSCRSHKDAGAKRHKTESVQKGKKNKGKGSNDKTGKGLSALSKSDNKIVKEASDWLGTPYAFGKAEKGKACDCSGMVMGVYEKAAGIKLPRTTAKQKEFCKSLKKKDVKVGDLCFFATGQDPERISHVGIMIDETNFIHASSTKGVVVSDITQPYWVRTFRGFGRVPLSND